MTLFKGQPSVEEIENALDVLTRAIGVYGPLVSSPVSIEWGNGVCVRRNGAFNAGGPNNVTVWIDSHRGKDLRTFDELIAKPLT